MNSRFKVINQIPIVTNKTDKSIDLNLYGPVVDEAGWFIDENSVITPKKVQSALNDAGNVSQINVHLNSPGGSVFAGQAVHNVLRQHPANVTVYVDGLAASIASVIAMAGNKIVMPPGAMMMIHNPLVTLWGSYQAGDCREMADFLDKIKESIVATYTARCAKKTKDEIVALMDETTWLTAQDAVDMGFADQIDGGTITANMTGKVLNIAGMAFDLSPYEAIPQNIIQMSPIPNKTKEENVLDLKELKDKYPELYNQIIQEGVSQERNRMKALDSVQIGGFEDIVNKARYETGATAEQVAVQIINAQKEQGANYLKNLKDDVETSNLTQVPAAPAPDTKAKEEKEINDAAEKIASMINEGRK